MWPWGHAAIGYLLYTAYSRQSDGLPPSGGAAVAVVVGTQFPDVVDKPLAWTFGVLPTGRSLAHSWLVAVIVLAVAWRLLEGRRRALLVPFGVGWLSHGLADGVYSIFTWELAYLGFFLWPVTSVPPYETEPSFAAHLIGVEVTTFFVVQLVLVGLATVVWHHDGRPGLETVRELPGAVVGALG